MTTIPKFMLSILGLVILAQCHNKHHSEYGRHSNVFDLQPGNSVAGEWKYQNSIYYFSELTLNNSGSFIYHDQSCYGQNFTKGSWMNDNGIITLKSDEVYKPFEEMNTGGPNQIKNISPSNNSTGYSFLGVKEARAFFIPSSDDTIKIYFDGVKLRKDGDMLVCIDNNEYIATHAFIQNNNKR